MDRESYKVFKNKLQVDRIEFDKSVWTTYYQSTVKNSDNNGFDKDLIDFHDIEDQIITKNYGKGKEQVLELRKGDPPAFRAEIRLKRTKSMNTYFNFNRYLCEKNNLQHDNTSVLRDNNFLPIDQDKVTDEDYLRIFKAIPDRLNTIYEAWYKRLWQNEYKIIEKNDEKPITICKLLEVGREMYPTTVKDLIKDISWVGKNVTQYHDVLDTIYINPISREGFRKENIDNVNLSIPVESWERKKPYEDIEHIKMYQKTPELTRFEITLINGQVFNKTISLEDIKVHINTTMEEQGIIGKSKLHEATEILQEICKAYRIDRQTLFFLARCGTTWESTLANRELTKKLLRRGILIKEHRGIYKITPLLKYAMEKAEVHKAPGDKVTRIDRIILPRDANGKEYDPMSRKESSDLMPLKLDETSRASRDLHYERQGAFEIFTEKQCEETR